MNIKQLLSRWFGTKKQPLKKGPRNRGHSGTASDGITVIKFRSFYEISKRLRLGHATLQNAYRKELRRTGQTLEKHGKLEFRCCGMTFFVNPR